MVCIVIKDWFQGKFTHTGQKNGPEPKAFTTALVWRGYLGNREGGTSSFPVLQLEPWHPPTCNLHATASTLSHGVLQHIGTTPHVRFLHLPLTPQTFDLFWSANVFKNPWDLGSIGHICFMWSAYVIHALLGKNSVNLLFWGTRDQTHLRHDLLLQSLYIKKPQYYFCQNHYIK